MVSELLSWQLRFKVENFTLQKTPALCSAEVRDIKLKPRIQLIRVHKE